MKFSSQICTTKEQSERLLALGLNKETADCHYEGRKNRYEEWEVSVIGGCYYSWDFPAWSLHRLIEMYGSAGPIINESAGNMYSAMIDAIKKAIKNGTFNKEYRL